MKPAHEVLGVQQGAPISEVRAAFRRYAALHHPDHGGDPDLFATGQEAYRRLVAADSAHPPGSPDVVLTFHHRRSVGRSLHRALTTVSRRISRRPVPPPRLQ